MKQSKGKIKIHMIGSKCIVVLLLCTFILCGDDIIMQHLTLLGGTLMNDLVEHCTMMLGTFGSDPIVRLQ